MAMSKRRRSDTDGKSVAILLLLVLVWWLRWLILTGAVIALLVFVTRRLVRSYLVHRANRLDRLREIGQRAEIQNAQVLRGDPRGFYGQYPLPDPELIPRWYKTR